MSELMLEREIRSIIRTSGYKASSKMLCPIMKLLKMKYKDIDNKDVTSIAVKIINEN